VSCMKSTVLIFYSSNTEPGIIDFYRESLAYLKESNTKVTIIDVAHDTKKAIRYKIIATPTIVVQTGKKMVRHLGIVSGMKGILKQDLYGKSILHLLGFKEGRTIGKKMGKIKNKKQLEQKLNDRLKMQGIEKVHLKLFDRKKHFARLSLVSDQAKIHKKSTDPICFDIAACISGIFTEIFNTGAHFKETACIAEGRSECVFETMSENGNKK
jgi:predicted hydrocarbon binding protein